MNCACLESKVASLGLARGRTHTTIFDTLQINQKCPTACLMMLSVESSFAYLLWSLFQALPPLSLLLTR